MVRLCFKKKLTVVAMVCLMLAAVLVNAQVSNPSMGNSPFKFANPTPVGFTWLDMSFIDNNVGLAVGANGGIGRTTDGGRNWVAIPYKYATNTGSVSLATFNDVQMITPTIAYAVASGGLMIKSTDGGLNWTPLTTPLTALGKNINALHFLNKDTGYIGGAAINSTNTTNINDAPKIYVTRNGGATWDSLATPFRPQQNAVTLSGFNQSEIQRIHFVNDSVGYATGSCGNSVANYSAILWKIEKNVVKDYSIHRSKFGISATTGSYAPATQTYKGLIGINDSLVLISSLNNNVVLRIRTGKNDSTASAAPAVFGAYERGIYEIVIWLNSTATPFPANLAGSVAGQMPQLKKYGNKILLSSGNCILTSTDNGTSWTFVKPHPPTVVYGHWAFSAMDITPEGRIVVGTFNGLVYDLPPATSTWQTVYKNIKPLFYAYSDMDWADACNGIAVGSTGTIAKTSDGGKTWVDASNPIFEAAQIGLSFVRYPAVNKMFFSTVTAAYVSPDQGVTNNQIFQEPNQNTFGLAGFTMVGTDRAFLIGYRGSPETQRTMIFRTLNASAASPVWDTVKTFPLAALAPQLRNIKFANQDTGYVSGNRGKIYRTINGGNTWTDVSPDTLVNGNASNNYTGLSVVDGKTIFVGGSSRKLFRSTDAGVTWSDLTLVVPPAPNPVNSFSAVSNIIMNDASNGYISSGAAILKTTDGWATWSYDLAPGGFNSMCLYPKMTAPISNKKLYGMPLSAGSSVNSTNTAFIIEYSNAALFNVSSTESITSTCDNVAQGAIIITAIGGIAPYTFSINGGPFQSSNAFTNLTQGIKTITIKDAACGTFTKTVTIPVKASPVVNAGPDVTIVEGDATTLHGSSTGTATTIAWTPSSTLTAANTFDPIAKPPVTTTYLMTITNSNGCVSADNVKVTVLPYCLKVMNAFTPNGDGMNDKWIVTNNGGLCVEQVYVTVFNRYGAIVYKNDNYTNNWDGTYNGRPVADGTYYYSVNYRLVNGFSVTLKGDVTILR
jgi:gliding motility-associated-like protein